MNIFKLVGEIAVNNSDANNAIKETTGNASTASNKIASVFKKVGTAVVTAFAVDKIKDFGMACLQSAADAGAMESQFSQVFGNLEADASANLTKIADTAGITENRMKGSYTKIAAFAKTTGMETADALEIANRAMVAVADSAAFYDRSLEDTTESLQSFLKGNFENDAALGLSCTETTRNAAANELYGKSFIELSEAQKQLTLLKMVEDANALSGALGQSARESDTWTNQVGNLKQAWTDLTAAIGTPLLSKAVTVIKNMSTWVTNLTNRFKKGGSALNSIFDKLLPMIGELVEELAPIFQETIDAILPPLMDIIETLLPAMVDVVKTLLPPILEIVQMVLPLLLSLLQPILELLQPLLQLLQPIIDCLLELLKPLIDLISIILPPLIQLFSDFLKVIIENIFPAIQKIAALIKEDFNRQLESIMPILEAVKKAFSVAVEYIQIRFAPIIDFFKNIWEGIKNAFGSVGSWFGDTFRNAWERVKAVFSTGGKIFSGIKDGIASTFKTVVNALITGINTIITVPFNKINEMLNKIRGISILNVSPFANLWAENPLVTPQIPYLAKGTVVDKATPAVIGEDGAEAVIPLERNTQWIDRVAGRFVDKIGNINTNDSKLMAKLDELIAAIKALKVYLDGDVLVGELAPAFNTALGEIATANERGQ